jgi:alpha-glucosidase
LALPQAHIGFEDLKDPEAIANWPATLGRDGARTPIPWQSSAPHAGFSTAAPWLPVSPEHFALAVDRQQHDPGSQLALTRRLLGLRRGSAALRSGSLRFVDAPAEFVAFERISADNRLLCAFNLGLSERSWRPWDASPKDHAWQIIESVGGAEEWNFPPLSGLIARCPP